MTTTKQRQRKMFHPAKPKRMVRCIKSICGYISYASETLRPTSLIFYPLIITLCPMRYAFDTFDAMCRVSHTLHDAAWLIDQIPTYHMSHVIHQMSFDKCPICMYMYIYSCLYIYIYICICVCIYIYIYIYMYAYMYTCIYIYIHIHASLSLSIYIYAYIHTHTYIYIYVYTYIEREIHTYIHTYIMYTCI